jgi:hypothetical protein
LAATPDTRFTVNQLEDRPLDPDDIGAVDAAFLAEPDVAWVGGHGVTVLVRQGRPLWVTYARLRRSEGEIWCRVWHRLPGVPADADGGEDHQGGFDSLPSWLAPLFPPLAHGAGTLAHQAASRPVQDPVPPPEQLVPLPEGAAFPDVVQFAAHALEAHFVTQGRTGPTLVAWRSDGVAFWSGEGQEAAGRLHGWGRRLSETPSVRALGLFGLGDDEVDGRRVPMIALAMEIRDGGSILWLRRFERVEGGRARWLDPAGLVRMPGPTLGWFGGER